MDLGSALTGTILLIVCIVPFVIISYNSKKKQKIMLLSLKKIAQQHNCQINKHEFCGNFVIGIDHAKNFIFFSKRANDNMVEQYVDLAEVRSCRVVNTSRTMKSQNGNCQVIEKLELVFFPVLKNKIETTLEFYNDEVNMQLAGELQCIENWSKIVNNRLKIKK